MEFISLLFFSKKPNLHAKRITHNNNTTNRNNYNDLKNNIIIKVNQGHDYYNILNKYSLSEKDFRFIRHDQRSDLMKILRISFSDLFKLREA